MSYLCDCGTCQAIYADKIRRALSEVYLPEGVEIWMTHEHKAGPLAGHRPIDLIAAGRAGEVFAVAEGLSGQIAT
jgi:hypothetical protein